MGNCRIHIVSQLMHSIITELRFDRLDSWSEKLKGLNQLELHILKFTEEHPDMVLKDIRDTIDIPHSTLTSVVDRLEKRGLIRRTISQRDRRSFCLELTKKGQSIQDEHTNVDHYLADKLLKTLDNEEEQQTFILLLDKIAKRLS